MSTVRAIYDKGVFRPTEPVELPDQCEVEFEPRMLGDVRAKEEARRGIREVLSRRYDSGESDVAARHNGGVA